MFVRLKSLVQLIVNFLYSLVAWLFSKNSGLWFVSRAVAAARNCVYVLHGRCLFFI